MCRRLRVHSTPPKLQGGRADRAARRRRVHHHHGISSSNSSRIGLTGSGSSSGSCTAAAGGPAAAPLPDSPGCGRGSAVAVGCFGDGIRTRSAGPILPRNSAIVGKITIIFPGQSAVSSPYAPRITRLLILLRTRPRLSLVNQTTSFFSFFSPTSSSLTLLVRYFFSRSWSSAFYVLDLSLLLASSIVLSIFCVAFVVRVWVVSRCRTGPAPICNSAARSRRRLRSAAPAP